MFNVPESRAGAVKGNFASLKELPPSTRYVLETNELPGCTVGHAQERSGGIRALAQAFHQRFIEVEQVNATFFKERIQRDVPAPIIEERIAVGLAGAVAEIIAHFLRILA